ncbi:MAG: hypothetical protein COU06_01940 [Candidatus Harrisonbacteria bacterium CG10_big_fil_rev_8_21_14_0_10_38_8]|uniref:RloB domain-containing protein n=1 Tax=Candidatus Harrisonbacteria bacterium CG10_big_fil_rev_8_21_14_0_10_38_8 TaxID=1974582 RepID=A0A2M6WJY6_9BACT|nr:MAG: hypothetical protein COU06_01940 [Candidatus Harrisonbacteria bacterium CG10_big_fil_rev_8_21_14_0_10_38_8]
MSRTNPYIKKRRSAKRTLLIYGEGLSEQIFLKHLRGLYSYGSDLTVTIRNGKGGTAIDIIKNAINDHGEFDRRVVVLDNDKSKLEMKQARTDAKRRGIEILENSPCLEATLLTILKPGRSYSGRTSAWCKREFESKYLNKKKRTEIDEYKRFFPKKVLEAQRANVSVLNMLISLMQGKK